MGGRKPTLGYPSRTAAVLALREEGLDTRSIAGRIGIGMKDVAALESSAARSAAIGGTCRTVLFPVDLLADLVPHAERRGITANCLARRIIETVIDDGMVDSVLDDADEVCK